MDAAAKSLEAANPDHPALIDVEHHCDELFGIVNVPSGVWIDEDGMIVRPPEAAFPGKSMFNELMKDVDPASIGDERLANMLIASRAIKRDPEKYVTALRDWVEKGRESTYALSEDEVIRRSRPRPVEEGEAAAHFALAQHLWREGKQDLAIEHFRKAHTLQPDNWTYKRQAWVFADPLQLPNEIFEETWYEEVMKFGPERYYPPIED